MDREVFLEPPRDVKTEGKIWKVKKPLCGLNEASRKFSLMVKEVFSEIGMIRLLGDEAFYYCHTNEVVIKGMISSHFDDFILVDNKECFKEIT